MGNFELMLEKGLIEDPSLPISSYNYPAIRDRLAKRGVIVSSPTIIALAILDRLLHHSTTINIKVKATSSGKRRKQGYSGK